MDYERLLCATGPYEGEILRASDKQHPKKIAWIQCVGSRQVIPGGNSYCSSVCCTYTQKQVIVTKEHDADVECTIFHNDIRSHGKDFERYYERTKNLPGVRFIRSYVSLGKEIPETGNVTIRYSTPDEGVREEEFDTVVLSVGLNPPADYNDLSKVFGIELESHGFCATNPVNPIETSRPGIFVSSGFQGPVDIPESVYSASGAASESGELLDYRRNKLSTERIYPEERDISGEEPKIGVFVCHCGANIGRVVNVPSVVEYARSLLGVVYAQEQLFSCATNCTQEITDIIREKGLNRVVVAACSPRTLEPLFRDTLREAGINPYYFEFANIREHCSWVHSREKEEATSKAKDIVRMSVARACYLEPLKEYDLPVTKTALVIGGGLAGMTCALSIAEQGYEVHLVERESELGGTARRIYTTLEGLDVQDFLSEFVKKIYTNPLIHVYSNAKIRKTTGYVGNFVTMVNSGKGISEIKHGATVIATGADVYTPTEHLYGENEKVLTHLELEEKIAAKDESLVYANSLVMIQCVGCRNKDRNYCSRVCCSESIKNALRLKEINPDIDINILYRDMRTYGLKEDYYREAAEKEIRFIRYEPENPPKVENVSEDGRDILRVTLPDPVLNKMIALDADYLTLAAAVIPSAGTEELAELFRLTLNPDGFFKEAHVKLKPVEFATEGIYLCGMAQYPKHITETLSQAYGAAGRVLTLLSKDTVTASGSVCEVVESKCIGCGACSSACTYDAIEMRETKQGLKASVNPVLCKGDGLCNAKCPTGAISLKHYTNVEFMSQIDTAFADEMVIKS
ncbi:MAG: CoB--CoM heterodisulfide reductase iron-sulfur subunit A family protein [Dehalococcoidales bacterium]|nr:CoB--CoM heterodisulfide reductase iron-sulfur subunit A family protein [Dehalococcoidales bacterium]